MSKRTPKIQKNTTQKMSTLKRSRSLPAADFVSTNFLYKFVYGTKVSFTVAILLLVSFTLQGVETTYAAVDANDEVFVEETESEEEVQSIELEEDQVEALGDGVIPEVESTSPQSEEDEIIDESHDEPVNDSDSDTNPADESLEDTESETNTDETETVVDNPETQGESEVVREEDAVGSDSQDPEASENTEEESDTSADIASTTEEVVEITENTFETVSLVQSDSAFSFTKEQCTQLATGSFYCLEPQENTLADALFAAQDEEGDMEIYFIRNNEQVQITNNTVDDAAPFFDQNTNTIVWHRLIDDRFQIISYDIKTGEEEQLTRTSENNMEPNRQGDFTVWQRWIDGGWNIVLFDGEVEKQLTRTTSHNVAPYIHGTLVVWNRHTAAGVKTIEMYDIATDAYVTIDDPDGLSVANPRMVFVYDSLHPNGDIVTKGYDVLARKFIELDTLPRDLPDEIPHSDSTGETRALIQSKPSLKSEVEEVSAANGSSTPPQLPSEPSLASTTEALTLDLSAPVVPEAVEALTVSETFDLVIPSFESVATSSSEAVQE